MVGLKEGFAMAKHVRPGQGRQRLDAAFGQALRKMVKVLAGADETRRQQAVAYVATMAQPSVLRAIIDLLVIRFKTAATTTQRQARASLLELGWPTALALMAQTCKRGSTKFTAAAVDLLAEIGKMQSLPRRTEICCHLLIVPCKPDDTMVIEAIGRALGILQKVEKDDEPSSVHPVLGPHGGSNVFSAE
jgi:hypothetical protein